MYVKPAPVPPALAAELGAAAPAHLQVRDPDLRDILPAEGREVPETPYWHRRLRDGDVLPATPPTVAAEENEE